MTSDTQIRYGSRLRRHGIGRRCCRYQWRSARSSVGGGPGGAAVSFAGPRAALRATGSEPVAIIGRLRRIEISRAMNEPRRVRADFIDLIQRPDEALEL